jgi:hypothetical protein
LRKKNLNLPCNEFQNLPFEFVFFLASCCRNKKDVSNSLICKDPLAFFDGDTTCYCPDNYIWDGLNCSFSGSQFIDGQWYKGYGLCGGYRDSLFLGTQNFNNTLSVTMADFHRKKSYGAGEIVEFFPGALYDSFSSGLISINAYENGIKNLYVYGITNQARETLFTNIINVKITLSPATFKRIDTCKVIFRRIPPRKL